MLFELLINEYSVVIMALVLLFFLFWAYMLKMRLYKMEKEFNLKYSKRKKGLKEKLEEK